MKQGKILEKRGSKMTIFSPPHAEPSEPYLGFIMLPFGVFYEKTKKLLNAKKGDKLRFYNGPEVDIDSVHLIPIDNICDALSRMCYGISWVAAQEKWLRYARMEGFGRDIFSQEQCIIVFYNEAKA